uniref:Uncharacterized protein n=1 Tax=Salmonella sp. TaxID=599 RepID=A0A482ET39_SALSP|nr:hypothetical protein NNIBIDOC_00015 [Salmonella sp.]
MLSSAVIQTTVVTGTQAYTEVHNTFQHHADAVGEVVHIRVDAPLVASLVVFSKLNTEFCTGSRITIGEAMSIFARRQALPSSKPPARIFFEQRRGFSSTLGRGTGCFTRLRQGAAVFADLFRRQFVNIRQST